HRAGRADHVGEPYAVSASASVRPHARLGRAGAPRSRGAVVARLSTVLAGDIGRTGTRAPPGNRRAGGGSLCPAHFKRPVALEPGRGGNRIARTRASPDHPRTRPTARGDAAVARIARAQAACDRDVAARVITRPCRRRRIALGTTLGTPPGGLSGV